MILVVSLLIIIPLFLKSDLHEKLSLFSVVKQDVATQLCAQEDIINELKLQVKDLQKKVEVLKSDVSKGSVSVKLKIDLDISVILTLPTTVGFFIGVS